MTRTPFALLVTTALVVPAVSGAQTVDTACRDLQSMLIADMPEQFGDRDELVSIADAGDGEVCLVEIERIAQLTDGSDTATSDVTVADTAETTLTLEDEVTIAGRVLLEQSAPRVDVTSGDTDVEIEPGAPSVTVAEQAAQIVVRQAPANINIDMPAPTIRIEQAAPEIIITMPDPSVTVGAAQPQVRVVQADPVISVTQAPPGVNLELSRVGEGEEGGFDVSDARSGQNYRAGAAPEEVTTEDAEVNFTQGEPIVVMNEPTEQAKVSIERAEPNITFEQSEPVVNFEMAEPQIEFTQSGEPTVTFEQAALEGDATSDTTEGTAADTDVAEDAEAMPETDMAEDTAATTETGLMPVPEVSDTDTVDSAESDDTDVADNTSIVETETPVEMTGPTVEREGYNLAMMTPETADELIGANLYDINDEDIGEIGDMVIGADGNVESVMVEIGGFLGLGETNVNVPFDRLSVLQSNDGDTRAYIDATEAELKAMPAAD